MKYKKNDDVKDNSRINNFIKNTVIGIISQFFSLILSFVSRTIFIKILSESYLGINGLFSNILSTLSFIELGFGTAIIYMMYKPVAERDKERIKTLVNYYKQVYFKIGCAMLILGLMVIPFMKYIIKEPPLISENLILIYILFLINTCIGYFYSHKTAIINANQKNYIITLYNQIFKWIQLVFQIIILLVTHNYILYLLIQILCTFFNNIFISIKADKMYPYIKEKKFEAISNEDKENMNNKIKSLIFYKLNPSILNGSDNLILSAMVGVSMVGIYSNYYLITNYLFLFLNQITSSLESSIGNLNSSAPKEKKEDIFYKVLFLCFLVYGIVSVLLMALVNDFINIWIGEKYLFNNLIVFSIVLYLYVNGVCFACYSFRTTTGLFEKAKLVPLVEVVLNIAISIVLVKIIGVSGVFFGTTIARWLTFFWTDPKLLYNNLFEKNNIKKYFIKYFRYLFIVLFVGVCVFKISQFILVDNYLFWFIKAIILSILTLFLFVLFTFKTVEFNYVYSLIKTKLFKRKELQK